jgi:hypothetical protein
MNKLTKINIQQVLITQPIIDVALEINPILDIYDLSIAKDNSQNGFKLNRMENMMNADFDELLLKEPIVLKPVYTEDGKRIGKKINGKLKPLYEIIDGRHRICRVILERMTEIECIIM